MYLTIYLLLLALQKLLAFKIKKGVNLKENKSFIGHLMVLEKNTHCIW